MYHPSAEECPLRDCNRPVFSGVSRDPPGGELIARLGSGSTRYYHFDELGSTRLLTDDDGDVTDDYEYDAWGNLIDHTGSTEQPYQFVGRLGYCTHYQDPDFGLLQLGVRFYDPETGRFTQRDAFTPWAFSDYPYCQDAPLSLTDPSGLKAQKPQTGIASCYGADFANCCTSCGECFNQSAATAAVLPEGKKAGWGCGDIIECCRTDNKKNCITVTINDTGVEPGRLIDFGCGYIAGKGFFTKKDGTKSVVCRKTGHKDVSRKRQTHEDCGPKCSRGIHCKGKIK